MKHYKESILLFNKAVLLLFLLLSGVRMQAQCAQDVSSAERDALIALYNATDGANWTNNTNWNTSACVSDWCVLLYGANKLFNSEIN